MLLIGDSGGIGSALRSALEAQLGPDAIDGVSRSRDGIEMRDPATIDAALDRRDGPYDLILVATGALEFEDYRPEKALKDVDADGLRRHFEVNTIGPAMILRHAPRLLPRERRGVFAALSARVGSIGDNRLGGWYGYRSSKAALNQILRCAAIELARTHRKAICVALHPGTVATRFTERYRDRHAAVPPETAASNLLDVIDSLSVADNGGFFDWAGKRVAW